MYHNHFGLREAPFSIAPDPRYLYMSRRHREALAHLVYGIESPGGFVLLTGEVGTGKTTVCRGLLERMPQDCDVAFIFNPKLTVVELLAAICDELRIPHPPLCTSVKQYIDRINAHLLRAHAAGRRTVLIIDEAQNLASEVLEQVRLLTNLETHRRKLLQIILLGQPELRDRLARRDLRQLAQRIVARYHLDPLSRREVAAYVAHRLAVAGAHRSLFTAPSLHKLYSASGGIPRLINVLCDRALLGAFVEGKDRVNRTTLVRAAKEVSGAAGRGWFAERTLGLVSATALAALGILAAVRATMPYLEMPAPFGHPARTARTAPAAVQTTVSQASDSLAHAAQLGRQGDVPARALTGESLEWTSSESVEGSAALSYRTLFERWGISAAPDGGGNVCRQVQTFGLRCHSDRGGLDALRKLNRPAVLPLRDHRGREFFAALTALDGDSATLVVGTDTRKISVSTVASHWSGSYTLLMPAPPNPAGYLRAGSTGRAVHWLSRQLARAQHRAPEAPTQGLFDAALEKQVREFQLTYGLVADGVVGPQTLMQLDRAVDDESPRLITHK